MSLALAFGLAFPVLLDNRRLHEYSKAIGDIRTCFCQSCQLRREQQENKNLWSPQKQASACQSSPSYDNPLFTATVHDTGSLQAQTSERASPEFEECNEAVLARLSQADENNQLEGKFHEVPTETAGNEDQPFVAPYGVPQISRSVPFYDSIPEDVEEFFVDDELHDSCMQLQTVPGSERIHAFPDLGLGKTRYPPRVMLMDQDELGQIEEPSLDSLILSGSEQAPPSLDCKSELCH